MTLHILFYFRVQLQNLIFSFSCSDEDIEDELDQLSYDNDCTEKLHSLYPNEKKVIQCLLSYQ